MTTFFWGGGNVLRDGTFKGAKILSTFFSFLAVTAEAKTFTPEQLLFRHESVSKNMEKCADLFQVSQLFWNIAIMG